jgi:hypothetical protein
MYRTSCPPVEIVKVPEMGEIVKDDGMVWEGKLYVGFLAPICALAAVMVGLSNGLLAGLGFALGALVAVTLPLLLAIHFESKRVRRQFDQNLLESHHVQNVR